MRALLLPLSLALGTAIAVFSCKKETTSYQAEELSQYVPLQKGKYITYRLDSTVFVNFNRDVEIHSYQEMHKVDTLLTDNMGRPAYRVFRFLRDTAGLQPWAPAGTYWVTKTENTIEFTEDNLRQVRLAWPLSLDNYWKANRYMPLEPFASLYNFSNDDNMRQWEFKYDGLGEVFVAPDGEVIDSVITVSQVDESLNVPIVVDTAFASINYGQEKYAKNLGLVKQELIMWEYQPNTSGPSGYRTGFGIKRTIIDHN